MRTVFVAQGGEELALGGPQHALLAVDKGAEHWREVGVELRHHPELQAAHTAGR